MLTFCLTQVAFNRQTSPSDSGDNNIHYLDRHDIKCFENEALQGFKLDESSNQFTYQYACANDERIKKTTTYDGNTQWDITKDDKKKSAHYLDRHNVLCNTGYALQSFRLETSTSGDNIRYSFKCVKVICLPGQAFLTPKTDDGDHKTVYLDRQTIALSSLQILTGFKLNNKDGKNYYTVNFCTFCDLSCNECSNTVTKCNACNTGYYKKSYESFPSECYTKLENHILSNGQFDKCDISCSNCETTKINCIACASTYFFKEDKKNCFLDNNSPIGYYFNQSESLHKSCDISCYTCSTKFECTNCADNYFPLEDVSHRCINKSLISYTNPDTNIPYYYNEALKNYTKCAPNCKICSNKPDFCTKCNYEDFYFHLEDLKTTCLKPCPDFYFRNFIKKECTKCHVSCKTCYDSTPTCNTCAPKYFPKSDLSTSCHNTLPNKSYVFNKVLSYWYKCPAPGLVCDEMFRYIECMDGFFLHEASFTCKKICPDTFWPDPYTKKCVACTPPCVNCKNNLICLTCLPTHHFLPIEFVEKNCAETCPEGYYPLQLPIKSCSKCKKECFACSTENICSSCNEGFFLNPDTFECKDFCDDGSIKNLVTRKCEKCDKNCKTCQDSITNCTSCKDLFLLDKKCVAECPPSMYKDTIYFQCLNCDESCLTCKGGRNKDCLTCDEKVKKLNLKFGYCTVGCPSGTIREIGKSQCINFSDCFDSINLSTPKIFAITDIDFQAELFFKLKDECINYINDLTYKWNEIEDSVIVGKKMTIKNDKLKEGILSIGVSLSYNDRIINTIIKQSYLILYKLFPVIANVDSLYAFYGLDIKISGALSKDEEYKSNEEDKELKFQWICSDNLASLCEKITTSELIIPFNNYQVFIKNPTENLIFKVQLRISKDKRSEKVDTNFTLKVAPEKLNLSELMIITPTYSDKKNVIFTLSFAIPSLKISDYKYIWTIKSFKDEKQYLNSRKENSLKILIDDLLSGINEVKLTLENPNNKETHRKTYRYLKPVPPYGGKCQVPNPNGISLIDEFQFLISDWISFNKPLL